MKQKIQLAALLLGMAAWAQPALGQDRIIGLLALPEVFGGAACERFTPRPVDLRATPRGAIVGTVLVVKPWTLESNGGCSGLEVGVRPARNTTVEPLPTMEHGYEEPGAVVLERRGRWFRVRLNAGSAWLEASGQDTFFSLEQLVIDGLTHLTDAWNGHVSASAGAAGQPVKFTRLADHPVRVHRSSRQKDGLWFFVEIMSHSVCLSDGEPRVVAQGWVPAYGKADAPNIWFSSRGC